MMPHSTQDSTESFETFDLTTQTRPGTADSGSTMKSRSRTSSSAYGVAVTSPSPVDERNNLPSQQTQQLQRSESGDLKQLRRRSTPGTAEDYAIADSIAQRGNLEELMQRQRLSNDGRSHSYNDTSKRRSQLYEEQSQQNGVVQTRDRVQRQTPVIAELKTNVIIKDEFTLVTDLSYQLAQRYARPDSSIMIKVDHSACLAMGGTFDPCYILTINAVTSQMGPSANKRNAALIQAFMAEILSVPAERGIITFLPIPEENLATCGNTILGEIEKMEKQDRSSSLKGTLNDSQRKSMSLTRSTTPVVNGKVNSNGTVNGVVNGNISNGVPVEKKTSQDSTDSGQTERPKTAHGTSSAVNGLRMNPISPDELRSSNSAKLPNGRPKSVGAPVRSNTTDQIMQEPIPNVVRQTSAQAAAQAAAQMRPQPVKTKSALKTTNSTPLAPRPVQVQPNAFTTSSVTPFSPSSAQTKVSSTSQDKKGKSVYLDMVTALPVKNVSFEDLDRTKSMPAESVTSANTAKRRSQTMTAAPRIPQIPPPPAAPEETRSMNSKLSKRKSIMKMFKRESKVEPWYKQ